MLVYLLTMVLLLWTAWFRFRRRRLYQLASRLPKSEKEVPVLGLAHALSGDNEDIMKQVKSFCYEAMQHDGMISGWCGYFYILAIMNPVEVEYVLKTCMDKSDLQKFTRDVLGNGGIFAPVPIWRRRRKIIVPTFSPKIVESFVDVFSRQSEKMSGILERHAGGGPFRMWPFLSSYTFDSVCETTMGVKMNALGNPDTPFLVGMNRVLDLVCQRLCHIWLHPNWLFRLLPLYKEYAYHLKKIYAFTDEVIKKKRLEIATEISNTTESTEYDLSNYKFKTFLDHLINLSSGKGESGFTNVELREELLTMSVAGTDTSAVAIGFTMTLLAKYPHIQENVYQELCEVFGESDRPLVKEDLVNLKYLERVVKESLRLFPPVPIILRQATEEVTLPTGRQVPDGAIIPIPIWGLHRDPKYWGPDSEEFNPDRFLPERLKLAHVCSFMPFSQGPRNCVGYQYAMMSIKTALSAVIRKYKIVGEVEKSPVPNIRLKIDVMLKAVDEYTVSLEKRKPLFDVK